MVPDDQDIAHDVVRRIDADEDFSRRFEAWKRRVDSGEPVHTSEDTLRTILSKRRPSK